MTEKEVKLLGFELKEGINDGVRFYYYALDLPGGLSFITNSNEETLGGPGGDWYIEFFEIPSIRYAKFEEFQALLNNLKRHIA